MIYWITGQPGAGKSTLAKALQVELRSRGYAVAHIDGEFMRDLTDNRDFSEAGRIKNIKTGQQLAAKLSADGLIVVASFVSPYRELREDFKRAAVVAEVYVHTSAVRGRERYFAAAFEPPQSNYIDIDTTDTAVEECVSRVLTVKPPPVLSASRA